MSAPPYMKLFWGDYHKATRHLTRDQHGAYFLLIGEAWRLGGALPDDDALLARWSLCTDQEWAEMRDTILAFFVLRRGKIWHDRVREELANYETISRKRKQAGKAGGTATGEKHRTNPPAIATQKPTQPEPEPKSEREEPTTTNARAPDWRVMLAEAREAIGDMADLTSPAMLHAGDLRGFVEPTSGEPCLWSEVLDAIRMTAARQRPKAKPIRSWKWIEADAWALRDKRLSAAAPEVAQVVQFRGSGTPTFADRIAEENAEARRLAFARMDAEHG